MPQTRPWTARTAKRRQIKSCGGLSTQPCEWRSHATLTRAMRSRGRIRDARSAPSSREVGARSDRSQIRAPAPLTPRWPASGAACSMIDPTADDCCCATNKLYSELALRCGRIGFRLPVRVPPAAAERAAVGACMTMRSWHGSGGSCAVLAMRDGGGGKNFGCLRPVGGLRRARGV